jgi:hypothetical protein
MAQKKGRENLRYRKTVKEKQNDDQIEYSRIVKETVSESARRCFNRPAYNIKRSGTGGQENIKSVSSISERDTKT